MMAQLFSGDALCPHRQSSASINQRQVAISSYAKSGHLLGASEKHEQDATVDTQCHVYRRTGGSRTGSCGIKQGKRSVPGIDKIAGDCAAGGVRHKANFPLLVMTTQQEAV
jgi:hypothetical protein